MTLRRQVITWCVLLCALAPAPAPAQTVASDSAHLAFNRYNNGDHWETTGPVTAGFGFEHGLGFLLVDAGAGRHALYGCTASGEHFISPRSNCEGQTVVRLEGYAYDDARTDVPTMPIYRCNLSDHFTSLNAACEQPGAVSEGLLGHVAQRQAALNRYACDPADHWVTSRYVTARCALESRLGFLLPAAGAGRAELFSCRAGPDQFLSLAADCGGAAPEGSEGWLYRDAPGPRALALYRCADTDRFASSDPGCENRRIEALLGYLLADEFDRDADGARPPADCDDASSSVQPGAADVAGNGIDEDCSGADTPAPVVTPPPPPGLGRQVSFQAAFVTRRARRAGRILGTVDGVRIRALRRARVTIVCARGCRSLRVTRRLPSRSARYVKVTIRLTPRLPVRGTSILEIRSAAGGYAIRYERYAFRRTTLGLFARQTAAGCLRSQRPRRVMRCPPR